MAKYFTLEYPIGTTERSFQGWGFDAGGGVFRPGNLSVGKFTVRIPGASGLTAAPPIPFEAQVIIRRNQDSADGSDNSFSGGEIIFQGRQISRSIRALPLDPGLGLEFGDAWYDLERLVFQQSWKYKSVGVPAAYQFFSRLNLYQNYATGGRYTNGQQITEILNYAITNCGVSLQAGTIDPAFNLLFYPVRAVMCASAIEICLQPTPDAVTWIDHSTTPPTFNCRVRANRTALNLPYADGVTHESSELVPRYDLQAASVVLQYQKINTETVGGVSTSWTDFGLDIYPGGSTGQELRGLVCAMDLRGASIVELAGKVTGGAIDPTSLDWWQVKKPEVKALRTAPNSIAYVAASYKVIDDATGTDITATWAASWPKELVKGEVTDWMTLDSVPGGTAVVGKPVTISAKFTYSEYDAAARKWHEVTAQNPHVFTARVKLTNSPTGEITYYARSHYDPGETAPAGLAQAIYTSLHQLEYEGTHTIKEVNASGVPEVTTIIGPQHVLNLTGGAAAWATMKANIQSTTIDFFSGRTEITVGPARHIAPGDLEQLLQAFRFRVVYDRPDLQVSGQQSSGTGTTTIGGHTQTENTTQATTPPALHTVAADAGVIGGVASTNWIQHDAANKEISIKVINAAGAPIAATPTISAKLQDIADRSPGVARAAKYRAIRDCKDGVAGYRIVDCTEFIAGDPPDDYLDD